MDMSEGQYITLSELDAELFACADILRGSVDSGKYKDYILPLVFYAAVDKWYTAAIEEELRTELGVDDIDDADPDVLEVAQRNVRDDFMRIRVPRDHAWPELEGTSAGVADRIDRAFTAFAVENERFSDAFQNDFTNVASFTDDEEGDEMLQELLQRIGDTIYHDEREIPPDTMGEAYMDLVKRFSEADAGEYFTTPKVVRLMVQLLEPFEEGSSFHDPTSGSGGMLVEAANQITAQYVAEHDGEVTDDDLYTHLAKFRFTGQERNPTVAGIGKMNLALHNIDGEILRGDSIANPRFTKTGSLEQFDYILANFPFSASGWKKGAKKRQEKYDDLDWTDSLPHGSYGDFAFIQHMESHLAERGQLATVIPHGILFRNTDQEYREWLLENDLIEAIIGLPENLFENTGIPSAILVLNRDKPAERAGKVLFFNAAIENRFYKDTGSDRNEIIDPKEEHEGDEPFLYEAMENPTGIAEIKQMFDAWESEERVCRVVSADEIRENDCNLNIALYVDTTEPQPNIDVASEIEELRELEEQYESLNDQFTAYMQQLNYE
jgi:Type I restriction-modification system methyltransferase subunit